MDKHDQDAIDDLFNKVAEAERQGGERDADAEAYIRSKVEGHPAAPYYMGQAIVMMENALEQSNDRIAQLEAELARRPAGGFLSGIFGGGGAGGQVPAAPHRAAHDGPSQHGLTGTGRGFLGSAGGTGIAMMGGALLGYGLASSMSSAEAAQTQPGDQGAEGEYDSGAEGFDDGGDFDMDF